MRNSQELACARCEDEVCTEGHDCVASAESHRGLYRDRAIDRVHRAATAIGGRHYGEKTRLGEIILFARELGCRRVGLAFCVGHDSVFQMTSDAPVSTLVAKDRALAHNPVGAISCQYVRRQLSRE